MNDDEKKEIAEAVAKELGEKLPGIIMSRIYYEIGQGVFKRVLWGVLVVVLTIATMKGIDIFK